MRLHRSLLLQVPVLLMLAAERAFSSRPLTCAQLLACLTEAFEQKSVLSCLWRAACLCVGPSAPVMSRKELRELKNLIPFRCSPCPGPFLHSPAKLQTWPALTLVLGAAGMPGWTSTQWGLQPCETSGACSQAPSEGSRAQLQPSLR